LVQMSIGVDAYKDANRAIFMQDNAVSDWWQRHVVGNPKEGDWAGKLRSKTAQFLIPFAKVPTNIVGETVSYIAGLPIGAVKLADAYRRGIENVTPEEADKIVRMFKKGSIGAGFFAIGYFNPNAIGGYYTGKRSDKDVDVGGLRIFNHNIPKWLVHNPLMEALQIGSTVRRVQDSYIGNTDEKQGLAKGIMEAAFGLAEEVPFVNEAGQLNKLGNENDRKIFVGEMAKNTLVPAAVQFAAKYTDKDVKRKPETFGQHIEMGIPGLRQNVSEKHSYSNQYINSPSVKFFTNKGMTLPYTSERSIQIKDASSRTTKRLSDYPKEKRAEFYNEHDRILEEELENSQKEKWYLNDGGHVVKEKSKGSVPIKIGEMNRKQLSEILSDAQSNATKKAKEKVFYKK